MNRAASGEKRPRLVATENTHLGQPDRKRIGFREPFEYVAHLAGGAVVHIADIAQRDVIVIRVNPPCALKATALERQGKCDI
jgi:hypothetical protein